MSFDDLAFWQIWLEFYQKRKSRWLFVSDSVPWEIWSVRVDTFKASSEDEWEEARSALGEKLVDVVFELAELVNSASRQVPQTPTQSELETVYDTAYADVQPFVFRMRYASSNLTHNGSVGNTVKKLIQDTLLA